MIGTTLSGELSCGHIVQPMENDIQLRAERYLAEVGEAPALSIIAGNPEHGPSKKYMGLKKSLGERLGIQVDIYSQFADVHEILERIKAENNNPRVNGIIVQLPLRSTDTLWEDRVLSTVDLSKDVDGLAAGSSFVPATVLATEMWLDGQGIDCLEEPVVLIGLGRLVNGPLFKSLKNKRAASVTGFDKRSNKLEIIEGLNYAHVIVSATGQPGVLTPELFVPDTSHKVLVDVGTAEKSGAQLGDVSDELRAYAIERGWALTPQIGGIGKLTVRTLFRNHMQAAEFQRGITGSVSEYRFRLSLNGTSSLRVPDPTEVERDEQIPIDG